MSKYKIRLLCGEYFDTDSLGMGTDVLGKGLICVKTPDGREAYANMDYVDLIIKDGDGQ